MIRFIRRPHAAAACAVFAASTAVAQAPQPQPLGGPTLLSEAFSDKGLAETRLRVFEAELDRAAAFDDFVGLAVAVVRDGEVVLMKTYGEREIGSGAPVTPDTVFRIASLSKGFAATLAGLAIVEGKLSLADPVAPFAPGFALKGGAEQRLTLEHILSHRTGLPPNAYDNLLEAGVPVSDILPRYRSVAPICAVGACYAYQNITFDLAHEALESVYAEPYEDLVRTRIFEPLGMTRASLGRPALTQAGDWARPHDRDRIEGEENTFTPWRAVEVADAYYRTPAAGGVNASIADMAKWLAAQMGAADPAIPASVVAALHAPRVRTPAETRRWRSLSLRLSETSYGLGWRVYDYAGQTLVNHSGGVEGYGAQIAFLPDRKVGIVILANTRAKRVWRILPAFLDAELALEPQDWLELDHETGEDAAEIEG